MANIKNISQFSCNTHRSRVFAGGIPRTTKIQTVIFHPIM